jgi:ketosteroid isomerase-like protein
VLEADSIAHALVQRAFDADAHLANPDSLYLAEAEIIVNGAPRADAPRFAGVAAGGTVQLGSSRFAVTGNYVWGTIQYRWVPGEVGKRMIDGWATLVIARLKDGGWRIVHAHSSTAPENP